MLRGDRVSVRALQESDLTALIALQNDVALRGEFLSPVLINEPLFRKEFQETGFLTKSNGMLLVVDLAGNTIGNITYYSVNYLDGFELSAQIYPVAARGKGLMTQGLSMVSRYLFDAYKINRLQGATYPENAAGNRLMHKCGFTLEGRLRGIYFHRGISQDLLLYSLLRSELDKLPA